MDRIGRKYEPPHSRYTHIIAYQFCRQDLSVHSIIEFRLIDTSFFSNIILIFLWIGWSSLALMKVEYFFRLPTQCCHFCKSNIFSPPEISTIKVVMSSLIRIGLIGDSTCNSLLKDLSRESHDHKWKFTIEDSLTFCAVSCGWSIFESSPSPSMIIDSRDQMLELSISVGK